MRQNLSLDGVKLGCILALTQFMFDASFLDTTFPLSQFLFQVLASSGADDQIALWDLAIERDEEQENTAANR